MNTNNRYISDDEIDRILGKIGEFKVQPNKIQPQQNQNIGRATEQTRLSSVPTPSYNRPVQRPVQQTKENDFTFSYFLDEETQKNVRPNIRTSSNYQEKAGFVRRFYAIGTDLTIVALIVMGFIAGAYLAFGSSSLIFKTNYLLNQFSGTVFSEIYVWLAALYFSVLFFYLVYFEAVMGQTPGKMFLNVQIVDSDNQKPSVSRLILRVLLFFIPVFNVFGVHNLVTGTKLIKRNSN